MKFKIHYRGSKKKNIIKESLPSIFDNSNLLIQGTDFLKQWENETAIISEENDKVIQDLKIVKSNKGFPNNIITKQLNQLSIFNNIELVIYGFNCIGVLTEWDEFKQYDWELTKQKNIPVFKHMIN